MRLTEQQLIERQQGLGGSEALAYCGKDPRCSPLQLYLRKIGEAGERPEEDTRQHWGHRLEPVVRDWLAEELGTEIHVPPRTLISALYPFMFANLDGLTDDAVVEIKTGDKFMAQEFGEVETDQVPIRYVLQIMHYLVVTGLKRAHLGALIGGNDARHYVIDYDEELAQSLIVRAQVFWAHVLARDPPAVQTLHDADKRWAKSSERAVIASPEVVLAIEEIKHLRAAEKDAGSKADAAELTLKTYMGDADTLTDARGKALCSWRSQQREVFDVKAFAEAHPDLHAQFRKASNFRVFRVK
jgi:putative phage-type endonuclease